MEPITDITDRERTALEYLFKWPYPFVSFTFILVILSGAIFFNEPLSWPKIAGMALIVSGILVGSQG